MDNQQQWSASSHQLADKFFKKALSNIEVARDFFAHHLPEGLQAGLDFASLRFMHNSFIDDDFYKFASVKQLLSMNLLSPTEIAKAVGLSLEDVLRCKEEAKGLMPL